FLPEDEGGVQRGRDVTGKPAGSEPLAALLHDAEVPMNERVRGWTSEADDYERLDDAELPIEPGRAGVDLLDRWLPVLDAAGVEETRPALDDVANVDVLARPTKGRPVASSCWPGPSPTKTSGASGLPSPNTTLFRVSERPQIVHVD